MKWNKIVPLLIVSVLVIGGLAVTGSETTKGQEGQPVNSVTLAVELDMESASGAVYEGDYDLFMHSIGGPVYQGLREEWRRGLETWEVRGSYNNLLLNPAHEGKNTTAINDAQAEGWIDDPSDVQWLCNDKNGDWTVNPFAHNDIRFALQYMNRQSIIEDLQDGFADPRYGFMATSLEVWQERFVEPIEENYGLSPEGNQDMMETIIQEAMQEIKDNVAFGEVTGSIDEGWYYEHGASDTSEHQIEIKIIGRVEDWRLELGRHTASRLSELGFDAWVEPVDSATAIPMAFFGSPEPYDNLDYHIYTGGWMSTAAVYYQEAACSQMYAPWYGFVQTYGPSGHWQYDDEGYDQQVGPSDRVREEWQSDPHAGKTVAQMDATTQKLYTGQIETTDQYWNMTIGSTQMGFEESIRIFLCTQQAFYPYNPDQLLSAVPESINGYDTYFGPRTMRTDDGELDAAILTGEDRPFMDNWNLYGGSSDVYGEYGRRMAREYGSWTHPQTGLPVEVNCYWTEGRETDPYERQGDIETDYSWTEDGLEENIEIPENAIDYIPGKSVGEERQAVQEWLTRDELVSQGLIEDNYSAVKATIDVHTQHVWHDGTDMSLQDVMIQYAREKELGESATEPYLQAHADLSAPWWGSIDAIVWDSNNGTYTVYGDYTFPIEDKIGSYYSMFPEVDPLTYEGWDHLHSGATDIYEQAGISESYDYEPGEDNWIHQISPEQNEDLKTILQTMIDQDYLPPYLDADNGAPMPMSMSELETQLNSLIGFIDEYDHSYVGAGPFYIEEYTEDNELMLERWDQYGYPFEDSEDFEYGYWAAQFEIEEARVDTVNAPTTVNIGEDFDVDGTGQYAKLYPVPENTPLTEDNLQDYRFTLRKSLGGEIVKEIPSGEIDLTPQDTFSEFFATISTGDIQRGGHYTLQLEVKGVEAPSYQVASTTVILTDPDVNLVANDWTIPEEVDEGSDGTITAAIENTGEESDMAQIYLINEDTGDEMMIYNETVPAGETINVDYDHTFENYGNYMVELRDSEDRYIEEFGALTVLGADIEALTLDVSPVYGEAPVEASITVSAENYGTDTGEIALQVDGETITDGPYELGPGGSTYNTVGHTFNETGTYEVTFGDLSTTVQVVETAILRPVELVVPEEPKVGDTKTIEATVDSQVEDTTAHLYVGGEEVYVENITGTGEVTFTHDYTFDAAGDIDVEVRDEEDSTVLEDTVTVMDMYNLNVTTEGEGSVQMEPEQEEYVEGTEVTLTAEPSEGYVFDGWTGDYEGDEDNITITMDEDKEITANFIEEVDMYTLTVDTEGDGSVSLDPDQDEYENGTEVTLTAEPADGYKFKEWQGTDETGEEITITMDEDKEVTAVFEEEGDGGGGGIPGFTLTLFVLAAVVAVAIYYQKKE